MSMNHLKSNQQTLYFNKCTAYLDNVYTTITKMLYKKHHVGMLKLVEEVGGTNKI